MANPPVAEHRSLTLGHCASVTISHNNRGMGFLLPLPRNSKRPSINCTLLYEHDTALLGSLFTAYNCLEFFEGITFDSSSHDITSSNDSTFTHQFRNTPKQSSFPRYPISIFDNFLSKRNDHQSDNLVAHT